MILILPLIALLAAGIFIAHKFSHASRARERATKAVATLQTLDIELRSQYQGIQNSISQAATSFIQDVRAGRLRSIPLDELKKHEGGLRLQALKDSGIRTLADIQGWNENRISQVRGVGPKSASSIARLVYQLSSASNALPIPSPTPPFALDRERILLQAIYRDCWFEIHLSPQRKEFDNTKRLFEERLSQVVTTTTLARWLWGFGAPETVRSGIAVAAAICSDLEGDSSAAKLYEDISSRLATCRSVCSGRIESAQVLADYETKQPIYEWMLSKQLGSSGQLGSRPAAATSMPGPLDKDSALVSSGAGRSVRAVALRAQSHLASDGRIMVDSGSYRELQPLLHTEDVVSQTKDANDRLEQSHTSPRAVSEKSAEAFITFRVGVDSQSSTQQFVIPPHARLDPSSMARWVRKGETVTVQGFSISKGLFFYGESGSVNDQCTIDPRLSAKKEDGTSNESSVYYYSYATLSPGQRFRYLSWLFDGALNADDAGLGMLYFAGLERRLLLLSAGQVNDAIPGEQEELLSEVARVGDLFHGTRGAVAHYSRRLVEFISAESLSGTSLPELPELWERSYELPQSLLYGLGYLIQARRPIPIEWALRWVYVEPTIYLRTPATRCKSEFESAFAHVYKERLGEGLLIPPNKTLLKISYHPVSYSLTGSGTEYKFPGIPDVRALTAPQQTLREIVERSTAMVDSYSRFLGRNASKAGSLEAYLTLPLVLWPENAKQRLQEIQTTIAEKLQPVPYKEFLHQLGCEEELSSGRTTELVKSLSNVSLGFEPDVLAGAKRPRPSDTVVLFTLSTSDDTDRTTPTYKKASLTIALAATVALADGHASDLEMEAVDQMISRWGHLHLDLRARLRAQYRFQVHQPSSLASLKTRLTGLTTEDRTDLAMSMSALANVDGVVFPEEVKLLEQVYRTLELEPQMLYSHLHGGAAKQWQPTPLSSLSDTSAKSSAFLDAKRIIELRQETDAVTELLAGVFVEEETDTLAPEETLEMRKEDKSLVVGIRLPGLDTAHDKFLSLLLTNSVWSRADLLRAASESQIMLDGALERINEAALDFSGEVLIEGDDPLYVQQSALENAQ
jgi:uncharacterized tellurite resistance protein B-like protein